MPRGSLPGERRGGRQKGTPNKATQNLVSRLEELGCDPLELSAKIALGQELDGPHPTLKTFRVLLGKLGEALEDDPEVEEALALHAELCHLVEEHLTKGYVPMELRSKHIVDLTNYVHPKRQAIAVSGPDEEPISTLDVSKLDTAVIMSLLAAQVSDEEASDEEAPAEESPPAP